MDFSASMNDDSSLKSGLGLTQAENSLDAMWDSLVAADPKWPRTNESKFLAGGFGEINSYSGTYISSYDTDTIYQLLRLDEENANGKMVFPFPQSGRKSDGSPRAKRSDYNSKYQWENYIRFVKYKRGAYRKRYGYRTLMDYLQERRYGARYSEDLWRTPHYPFIA